MKSLVAFVLMGLSGAVWSQAPAILLEACNAMEPAAKRLECLRAANGRVDSTSAPTAPARPLYSPTTRSNLSSASTSRTVGGKTCYVGPRGGTYTITASGRKNYGGC